MDIIKQIEREHMRMDIPSFKPGDAVKNGQVVLILEAMKMENEIFSPCDGTVKEVRINEGAAVQPGEVLVVIG